MAPSYIIQRALYAVPIAIGVTVICFALIYLGPVDPVAAVMPDDATPEQIAMIRAAYGFDRPLPVQYFTWLGHVATGISGSRSRRDGRSRRFFSRRSRTRLSGLRPSA